MAQTSLYRSGFDAFVKDARGRVRDIKDQQLLDAFLSRHGSPHDALACASSLKNDADKKYGERDIVDGKVKIEKRWISNILGNIQNFIKVGDFVMKKAPESVGAAWFAVSLALTALQNNYALYSLFGAGLSDMTEMMITITHYDRLYDERSKSGYKDSEMLRKLFKDITETYVAMLDFSFSIQRHLSGSGWAKLRHGIKDLFNAEGPKFKAKADRISSQKKKVIEDSEAAFQEKTFQQFGDVQNAVKENVEGIKQFQKTSEEFYHAQLAMQEDLQTTLNEIKQTTRPRTRWDWAFQEYEKNRTKLTPLEKTGEPLFDALDEQLDGTCAWLPKNEVYKEWSESAGSSVLCITGREGVGKSILLASAFARFDNAADQADIALQYLSCNMSGTVEVGENSPKSYRRISNTLVAQLYQLAIADETNAALLENCNKIFSNPKDKKSNKAVKGLRGDDDLPELAEALNRLAIELKKKVVIVLDDIDSMNEADQDELYDQLKDLLKPKETDLKDQGLICLLLSCCSDHKSKFYQRITGADSFAPTINMENFNRSDIETRLDAELSRMSGWSEGQKQEAKAAILEKAGPIFKYVVQVAIPFIQEPYQGPLSARLKVLPDGMGETYLQAVRAMPSNYLNLLRTALSWSLFSARPMKVIEIMESYSGDYLHPPTEDDMNATEANEDWTRSASDLELQQLRAAAGPFLDVFKGEDDLNHFVELKDDSQIRQFCLHDVPETKPVTPDSETLCSHCKTSVHSPKTLSFSEKESHLELAILCIRHLRNPLLWKRFYGWQPLEPEEPVEETTAEVTDGSEEEAKPELEQQEESNQDNSLATNGVIDEQPSATDDKPASEELEAAKEGDEEIDSGYDSDDSMDDEDRGGSGFNRRNADAQQNDDVDDWKKRNDEVMRYEMAFWAYHVQKAEALWSPSERADHPRWILLIEELDGLAFECPKEFARCQCLIFLKAGVDQDGSPWMIKPWKPLHVACFLGITSWTEHLINKGESLSEICAWRTPLQAASRGSVGIEMLRLLLEKGANPNDQTEERMPATYSWLMRPSVSKEEMQLFLQHGARIDSVDLCNGWNIIHYLASECDDINMELFKTLLNKGDPTNQPNINAPDSTGVTAFHNLMRRREVPMDIMEAFIEAGADVNAEDQDSERPLQVACGWGDEAIIKAILPRVQATGDVDDPDKHGRTAIHQAAWSGYTEIVSLLIDHGANVNVLDKHDRTPLFFACLGERPQTAALILDNTLKRALPVNDINKITKRGRTPLRQAAAHGFTDVVSKLLNYIVEAEDVDKAAIINQVDERKGRSALHCAAFEGQTEAVRLLLEHKADPSIRDKNEKTALDIACARWILSAQDEFQETIGLLIDADPSAAINDTELISAAASNGSKPLLQKLHFLTATLNRADQYGWTPLMLARHAGHIEAENFLARVDTLPSRWINTAENVELSADGLGIKYKLPGSRVCLSTNLPLPAGHKKFYFEITSKKMEDMEQIEFPEVAIGLCTLGASAIDFPGWPAADRAPRARSWAYHGDDGGFGATKVGGTNDFQSNEDRRHGPGDTVGCGVDFEKCVMWFTKNGKVWEGAEEICKDVRGRLFPVIGIFDNVELETNFGEKEFVWKEGGDKEDGADANGAKEETQEQENAEEQQASAGAEKAEDEKANGALT